MKKQIVTALLSISTLGLVQAGLSLSTPAARAAGQLYWQKDFHTGLKLAKQTNKWVFVVISAEWCGPCKALHAKVLPDPTVEAFLNKNFVSIDLNADDAEPASMLEKYGAPGIPCLMVFSPSGQFKGKFVGAPSSAESFIRTVSAIVAAR
jgi:thiol:disulfide interchange protein